MDDSNVWDNIEIDEYESNDDLENVEAEQVGHIDEESDAASDAVQDIEGSDDEDIFMDKDPTRKQLLQKLVSMRKKDKEHIHDLSKLPDVGEYDWYSDTDDEYEPQGLSDYDKDDVSKEMYYKDGVNMKTFKFHQGLRFVSPQQFREVLRDWAVRNGYDLNFKQKVATTLLQACDVLSTAWGSKYLVLRAYEDDYGAQKLYSSAGYGIVSVDPAWTLMPWIGGRRRVVMVKQLKKLL